MRPGWHVGTGPVDTQVAMARKTLGKSLTVTSVTPTLATCSRRDLRRRPQGTQRSDMSDQVAALEARLAQLEDRLTRAEDVEAIRRLQYQYGYYLDKTYYEEVVELFADREDTRVHF